MTATAKLNPCNFFGPGIKTEELQCPIMQDEEELPLDHRITSCNGGIERVQIIDQMAQKIISSTSRPAWIKNDGSVVLDKLRHEITISDDVAKNFLNDKGYVNLSQIHYFDRDSLLKSFRNPAQPTCPKCREKSDKTIFSPALALFLHMRDKFNPKVSPDIYDPENPETALNADIQVPKPEDKLAFIKSVDLTQVTNPGADGSTESPWVNLILISIVALAIIGTIYYFGNFSAPVAPPPLV